MYGSARLRATLLALAFLPQGGLPAAAYHPDPIYVGEYVEFQVDIPNSGEGWFAFGLAQRATTPGYLRVSGMFCTDYVPAITESTCDYVDSSRLGSLEVSGSHVFLVIRDSPLGEVKLQAKIGDPLHVPLNDCSAGWRGWKMTIANTTMSARDAIWTGTVGRRRVLATEGCNYYDATGYARGDFG